MHRPLHTRRLLAASLLCCGLGAQAAELRVYNWSDYIGETTVSSFTQKYGIKVKYDVYDSDDTLQAKLLTGKAGYDIVVPTSNYLGRQAEAGIYLPLNKAALPNLKYLDPQVMKLAASADPGNKYGVPYAWLTDGMGMNVNKVKTVLGKDAPLDSWELLFNPQYLSKLKGCGVSVLDQAPDIFAITLHYLGRDPNSRNPADYQAALETLKKIRPYITQFNSSGYINDLANGDVCFAVGWSGDVGIAKRRAADAGKPYQIAYSLPKQGAPVSIDMMAIPKDAPNPDAALKWINHILDPEVSAGITNKVFYPTPNIGAQKYVNPQIARDPGIYPPAQVMQTLFLLKPLPNDILRLQNRLWTQLKSGR
ncbi:polyamine ABC transporter substrate-binding protein [uncultured Aquitalea sp.]|uniref:polyamine ABC transporter substrate-binding protein n=1 Tax=uncultured Aquitalea sp. TaxID=540272 RepID=UPI0025E5F368|nr:polyamine ABC transporter substrate-binding protein [uncultured Aquitalea sp.]